MRSSSQTESEDSHEGQDAVPAPGALGERRSDSEGARPGALGERLSDPEGAGQGSFESETTARRSTRRVDERIKGWPCGPEYRDWLCRKRGNLTSQEVDVLTNVTFLSAAEIRNIENVFELLVETMAARSQLETVTRRTSASGDRSRPREVVALTAKQLADHLPEFGENIFFDRLVRVFSESGQHKLTLLELIDVYSAMSRRANTKWKARIAFCVLDYDEDGVLGERDLVKALQHMIRGTKRSQVKQIKPSEAARHIQALWKGNRARVAAKRAQKQHKFADARARKTEKLAAKRERFKSERFVQKPQALTKLDCYAGLMVEKCTGIRKNCMEYRYFQEAMQRNPAFHDNFCLNMTQYTDLKRLMRALHTVTSSVLSKTLMGIVNGEAELASSSPGSPRTPGTAVTEDAQSWEKLGAKQWDVHDKLDMGWLPKRQVKQIVERVPTADGAFYKKRERDEVVEKIVEDSQQMLQKMSVAERTVQNNSAHRTISKEKFLVWWCDQSPVVQKYKFRLTKLRLRQMKGWCTRQDEEAEDDDRDFGAEEQVATDESANAAADERAALAEAKYTGRMDYHVAKAIIETMWFKNWQQRRNGTIEAFHTDFVRKMARKYDKSKSLRIDVQGDKLVVAVSQRDQLQALMERAFDLWDHDAKTSSLSGKSGLFARTMSRDLAADEGAETDDIERELTGDGVITMDEFVAGLTEIGHISVHCVDPVEEGSRTVYVTNLKRGATGLSLLTQHGLTDFFEEYGHVVLVTLNPLNSGEEAEAFITFATSDGAEAAIDAAKTAKGDEESDISQRTRVRQKDGTFRGITLEVRLVNSELKALKHPKAEWKLNSDHLKRLEQDSVRQLALVRKFMDSDGTGLVDKQEFVSFAMMTREHLVDHAAGMLSRDFETRDGKPKEIDTTVDARDASEAVVSDWDWKRFEKDFEAWWVSMVENANPTDGDGEMAKFRPKTISMREQFLPYWISDEVTDSMRDAAVEHVRWQDAVEASNRLWLSVAKRNTGNIAVKEVNALLGRVVGPEGHLLSKLTIKEEEAAEESGKTKRSERLEKAKDELLEKNKQHDSSTKVVKQAAFNEFWLDQHWRVKEATMKHLHLETAWERLGNSREELAPWQAKALLATVWGEKEQTAAGRKLFAFRFVEWWVERDRDQSGKVGLEELSVWWVRQPMDRLKLVEQIDWDKAEQHFSTQSIFEDLHHVTEEVSKREERYETALADFDKEVKAMDAKLDAQEAESKDGDALLLRVIRRSSNKMWRTILTEDAVPFGVLKGAVRPPMIRTRLVNFINLQDRMKISDILDGRNTISKVLHPQRTMRERKMQLESESVISVKTRDANGRIVQQKDFGGNQMAVGAMLDHYRKFDSGNWFVVQLHDFKIWWRKFRNENLDVTLFGGTLDSIERRFGHGIRKIMDLMKWMLTVNVGLWTMWVVLVILPRDYAEGGGGFWNSTMTIATNLLMRGDRRATSLFYDGYHKQPVLWLTLEVRLDLLYFFAVLGNVLVSLWLIRRELDTTLSDDEGSGMALSAGVALKDPATILGAYDFTVVGKHEELAMRQDIRQRLDTWLQSYEELQRKSEIEKSLTKKWGHKLRKASGKAVTLLLLSVHVYALTYLLSVQQSLEDKGVGFLAPLSISILNAVVPQVIKRIVEMEHHIHQVHELSATMGRIFAFKIIQLSVILYSLTKIEASPAAVEGSIEFCPETRFGQVFLGLVRTDALVFIFTQYFSIWSVNRGLPQMHMWYQVTHHFTKPRRTEYHDPDQRANAIKKENARKQKMCMCRGGNRLQKRIDRPKAQTLKEYFGIRHVPRERTTWWHLKTDYTDDYVVGGLQPESMQKEQADNVNEDLPVIQWAQSKQMNMLTGVRPYVLQLLGQTLHDAGYQTKAQVIKSNKNPEELALVISKQVGKHSYRYTDKNAKKKVAKMQASQALDTRKTESELVKDGASHKRFENPLSSEERTSQVRFQTPLASIDDVVGDTEKPEEGNLASVEFGDGPVDCPEILKDQQVDQSEASARQNATNPGVAADDARPATDPTGLESADTEERVAMAEAALQLSLSRAHADTRSSSTDGDTMYIDDSIDAAYDKAIKAYEEAAETTEYKVRKHVLTGEKALRNKPTDWPKVLEHFEAALQLNELDQVLQQRVDMLHAKFNKVSSRQLANADTILTFATELVKDEGEWEDVTDMVTAQRLHRLTPQKFGSFRTALLMMDIIYRQTFVWVGSTWCPWLPFVAAGLQLLMFTSLKHAFLGFWWFDGAYEGRGVWSAEQIFSIFMNFALVAVMVCAVPILVWLNTEPTCGPHDAGDYIDHLGERVSGHGAKVYETIGVFLEYAVQLQTARGETDGYAEVVGTVGSFFVQPPVLIIMLLFLLTRYQRSLKSLSRLQSTSTKRQQRLEREREYLESQLRDVARKASSAAKDDVFAQQGMKELANRKSENGDIEEMLSEMYTFEAKLGVNEISLLDLQQLTDIMSTSDLDDARLNGVISAGDQVLFELLAAATIWIGGIDKEFATEDHVAKRMQASAAGCMVLACTVNRISNCQRSALIAKDEKEAEELSKAEGRTAVRRPEWHHLSWALVTFVQPTSAEAKLMQYDYDPANPPVGMIEGAWHAEMWRQAQKLEIPGLSGELGSNAKQLDNSPLVMEHNNKIQKSLNKVLETRRAARADLHAITGEDLVTAEDVFGETESFGSRFCKEPWIADSLNKV